MFLVTGGAGYIGVLLVERLLQKGLRVRVFDKLIFGEGPLHELRKLHGHRLEVIQGDVRDFDTGHLNGIDAVIHLGGLSNDPTAEFDPEATWAINVDGTVRIAEAARSAGVRRFSFASSAAVYGFHVDGIADEDYPTNPRSLYAESRVECDRILMNMADDNFFPVSLRQGTAMGASPRWRFDLAVNTFTRDAFRNKRLNVQAGGQAYRPFVHVRDTADAHYLAVTCPEENIAGGQIFNLVHENYQILDLAHRVRHILHDRVDLEIDVDYSESEPRSYRISGEKLKRVLGFVPTRTVADAVTEMYEILVSGRYNDFDNPYYYNMPWLEHLLKMETFLKKMGYVLRKKDSILKVLQKDDDQKSGTA